MTHPTDTSRLVRGHEVAAVLTAVRRRLSSPSQWSPDAWATLADGTPITDLADLHRAAAVSATGAIDATTSDLGLQEAACKALREACDGAGLHASLRRIDQTAGHGLLMTTLQEAIALARSRRWAVRAPVAFPEGPPTLVEYHELVQAGERIDRIFFADERQHGEQFEVTRAIAVARCEERRGISDYLARHADAIDALVSASGGERTLGPQRRARKVRSLARTLLAAGQPGRSRRRGDAA